MTGDQFMKMVNFKDWHVSSNPYLGNFIVSTHWMEHLRLYEIKVIDKFRSLIRCDIYPEQLPFFDQRMIEQLLINMVTKLGGPNGEKRKIR